MKRCLGRGGWRVSSRFLRPTPSVSPLRRHTPLVVDDRYGRVTAGEVSPRVRPSTFESWSCSDPDQSVPSRTHAGCRSEGFGSRVPPSPSPVSYVDTCVWTGVSDGCEGVRVCPCTSVYVRVCAYATARVGGFSSCSEARQGGPSAGVHVEDLGPVSTHRGISTPMPTGSVPLNPFGTSAEGGVRGQSEGKFFWAAPSSAYIPAGQVTVDARSPLNLFTRSRSLSRPSVAVCLPPGLASVPRGRRGPAQGRGVRSGSRAATGSGSRYAPGSPPRARC